MQTITAHIISEYTLRAEDLLSAYANELEWMIENGYASTDLYLLVEDARNWNGDYEDADYLLDDIEERINSHLPEGFWFGSHPDMPDCIGVWEEFDEDEF